MNKYDHDFVIRQINSDWLKLIMTYDPTKKEVWTIASSGFWRQGEVNKTQYMVEKLCTWQEAKDTMKAFRDMECRHYDAVRALEAANLIERNAFISKNDH